MRQTLNILQSVVLAHEHITEEDVYLCTGNPPPNVVENIVQWLLNEEMQPAFQKIFQLQVHYTCSGVEVLLFFALHCRLPEQSTCHDW